MDIADGQARLQAVIGGAYTLERELGRGGMATVYLAYERKHGRKAAVKVLHPELAALLGPERFLQEIRVTARLQHPHILGLIDSGVFGDEAGELGGRPYYVMPYVEGESLRARLDREGQRPTGGGSSIAMGGRCSRPRSPRLLHSPSRLARRSSQATISLTRRKPITTSRLTARAF